MHLYRIFHRYAFNSIFFLFLFSFLFLEGIFSPKDRSIGATYSADEDFKLKAVAMIHTRESYLQFRYSELQSSEAPRRKHGNTFG